MAYSTIIKPTDYFNTKLYTGTGASSQAQTGVGFEPSFVWIKSRSTSEGHVLADAVRGVTKYLISNTTSAQVTNTDTVKSFDSDGYTIGPAGVTGGNGVTFASWNWKAGTAVSGATTGSGTAKTYTGSVNTTAGFSIINYIGNSGSGHEIPHRLGVTPKMIIVKCLNQAQGWTVYHQSLGSGTPQNYWIRLDETGGQTSASDIWNNTAPNATNFTVGDSDNVNGGLNYIAYCFADVPGFSKMGSYRGNGNANGTFVYTGFKPAFIILKTSTIASNDWVMFDNKRLGYNVSNDSLKPNSASTEQTGLDIDLLSNGFKLRGAQNDINGNGGTYIFMAFAETPFVANSGASIPTTAR